MTDIQKQALAAGFTHTAPLDISTIRLKPEVRQMCAGGNCRQYGMRWSCPPGCGELETLEQRIFQYHKGILVQTVGQLEDAFDGEGMLEAEQSHKSYLLALQAVLLPLYPRLLTIGAGCCTQCKTCTYPDAPCRFPEKQIASMEAYGMEVAEVCRRNGLPYHHGPNSITYTSCFLLE